jgi:toluene monooxygenase system ferredoxin subunit
MIVDEPLTEATLDLVSERIATLLDLFEAHPDSEVRENVFELLQQIDALHRAALKRILSVAAEDDPGLQRLTQDPIIDMVLSLYDLVPESTLESCARVRGPLPAPDTRQQPKTGQSSSFIPLALVQGSAPLRPPRFERAMNADDLREGSMCGLDLSGERVLLCRVAGEVYAFRNRCPGSVLPLDLGRLDASTIICPWHECRFDARTGMRLDGGDGRLEVLPASTASGQIQIALGVMRISQR